MEHLIDWFGAHLLPCTYKHLFGISCPCCGFQRSVIALLKGDILQSFLLYPALLPSIASLLLFAFFRRDTRKKRLLWVAGIDTIIALIGCILKNTGVLPD